MLFFVTVLSIPLPPLNGILKDFTVIGFSTRILHHNPILQLRLLNENLQPLNQWRVYYVRTNETTTNFIIRRIVLEENKAPALLATWGSSPEFVKFTLCRPVAWGLHSHGVESQVMH
jgi:hypothetical protein